MNSDSGQRNHGRDPFCSRNGNGDDAPGLEFPGHRGESETRVLRNVRNVADLSRREGGAEFPFEFRRGKRGPSLGNEPDGFKMVEGGFPVIQQIDGSNLRPGVFQQPLEQFPTEGSKVFFPEHGPGDPGSGFPAPKLRLNRFGQSVEPVGKDSEFIGGGVMTAGFVVPPAKPLHRREQLHQRFSDVSQQGPRNDQGQQQDDDNHDGQLTVDGVVHLLGLPVELIGFV